MVGKNWWQQVIAVFCKPSTRATVRYFEHADGDETRKWLGVASRLGPRTDRIQPCDGQ
ncbi:MAG: STAS/SEC14 domain-containing protein [Gammaproteobacteria bacterium]